MEKKLGTLNWYRLLNISLFAICIVDSWLAYSHLKANILERQSDYYSLITEELIYKRIDEGISNGIRCRLHYEGLDAINKAITNDVSLRCDLSIHMAPYKRRQ